MSRRKSRPISSDNRGKIVGLTYDRDRRKPKDVSSTTRRYPEDAGLAIAHARAPTQLRMEPREKLSTPIRKPLRSKPLTEQEFDELSFRHRLMSGEEDPKERVPTKFLKVATKKLAEKTGLMPGYKLFDSHPGVSNFWELPPLRTSTKPDILHAAPAPGELTATGRKKRDLTSYDRAKQKRFFGSFQRYTPGQYASPGLVAVDAMLDPSLSRFEKLAKRKASELAVGWIESDYDQRKYQRYLGKLEDVKAAYNRHSDYLFDFLKEYPSFMNVSNAEFVKQYPEYVNLRERDPQLFADITRIEPYSHLQSDQYFINKQIEISKGNDETVASLLAVKSLTGELKKQMHQRRRSFGGFPRATSNNPGVRNFYMPTKYPSKKRYSTKYRTGRPVTFTGYKRAVTSTGGPNAKVQKFSVKSKIPGYSSLSKTAASLVDQIIDPSNTLDVSRWPNTYGLSATYKCRNIHAAVYDPLGNGLTIVHPRIGSGILMTAGTRVEGAIGDDDDANSHLQISQHISSSAKNEIGFTIAEPMARENFLSYPVTDSKGRLVYFNPFRSQGGDWVVDGKVIWQPSTQNSDGSLDLKIQGFVPLGAAELVVEWLKADFELLPAGNASQDGIALPTIRTDLGNHGDIKISEPQNTNQGYMANAWYIRLSVSTDNEAFDSNIIINFVRHSGNAGSFKYAWPNVSTVVKTNSLKDADTITRDADKFIVMSQSLLVTSQMSSNNNSGQCSTARLPGGSKLMEKSAVSNSPYEWIASLPYNSYNGPVKNGSYTFYLPDDERGFQYQQIGSVPYKGLPYLVAAYYAPDDAHSIRIQVDTIVQFTTNASLYQLGPSPQLSDLNRVHYLLSALQASYTNDGHIEGLKKHLAKLGGRVKEELLKPGNWARAGKAVMKYGPMLASAALI